MSQKLFISLNVKIYLKSKREEVGFYHILTPIYKLSTWLFFEPHEIIDRSFKHQFSVNTEPVTIEAFHARSQILFKIADNDSSLVKPPKIIVVHSFVFPLPW